MSAPSPAPAPPTPAASAGWPTSMRLLGVVVFVAFGFAAVWQGFGAAGFGTDTHTKRVCWACLPLVVGGALLVGPKGWLAARVLVALVALGAAGYLWWTVQSSDFKSAMSLREAVESRDRYRALLATATVDDIERYEGLRGITFLLDQYPTLVPEMSAEYDKWKDRMGKDLVARYNQTPPDDLKAIPELRALSKRLGAVHPSAGELLQKTDREWIAGAVRAKTAELAKTEHDWDAFDRTAPGRKAMAEAFPEARAELVAAEEEWGEITTQGFMRPQAGRAPVNVNWRGLEKSLLACRALDTGDGRFAKARGMLFAFAHNEAKAEAAAHLEAGRYDRAFGVARKHAVEWNATATLLGEQKKLDDFRERYAFFDALKRAAEVESAPPPHLKPK